MSSLLNLDLQDAEKAKEKSAWVAQDFDAELQKLKMLDSTHGPAKEREKGFLCGELLFDVQASASACASTNASREPFAAPSETLPSLVMSSLRLQSNINLRGKLLENIILFGGTAQLPGLQPRFEKELRSQSQWVAPGQSLDMVKVCEVNTTSPHGEPCSQMSLPCFGASLVAACLTSKIAGLAVSRSFGDKDFKGPDIVSAEPEITVHEASAANEHALVKRAREKGSQDDCTAMGTCQGEAVEPEGEAEPQAHVPEEGANGEMEATWKGEGMHACYKRL
ncbi:unnamed protein product [Durusdinium trenchii]|uniref:PPM-type phosphatase domain-containing protein n=1 Tax=Durusdinium trenchii TaxID=1381693 RepID=A0ABP0M6Q8_9DINO